MYVNIRIRISINSEACLGHLTSSQYELEKALTMLRKVLMNGSLAVKSMNV